MYRQNENFKYWCNCQFFVHSYDNEGKCKMVRYNMCYSIHCMYPYLSIYYPLHFAYNRLHNLLLFIMQRYEYNSANIVFYYFCLMVIPPVKWTLHVHIMELCLNSLYIALYIVSLYIMALYIITLCIIVIRFWMQDGKRRDKN